jgi:hypothetical protein
MNMHPLVDGVWHLCHLLARKPTGRTKPAASPVYGITASSQCMLELAKAFIEKGETPV